MSDLPGSVPQAKRVLRLLDAVERFGNRLPEPATLFVLIALLLVLLSAALEGVGVRHPASGEWVRVTSLLSTASLARMLTEAVKNFAGYPPLATVLVVLMGVGIAERSGLVGEALRALVESVPRRVVTAALVFAGVNSSLAADAGIVVLPPLGALLFLRLGRHPLAGLAAAFAGVSAGFSANLFVTTLDPLLAGITETAARLVDPTYTVMPTANYYVMVASTFLLTLVGTFVTHRWVEPRLGTYEGETETSEAPSEEARATRRRGLRHAGIVVLLFALGVGWLTVPERAVLRDAHGTLKPFYESIVPLLALLSASAGVAYGLATRSIASDRDAVRMATQTLDTMGGYLLVAFAASQVIAYLGWSNLGVVLAVNGADALRGSGLPGPLLLVACVLGTTVVDLVLASASAKWALLAPVVVPMLMLLGFSPEVTQAAYRIGDSSSNVVTPLMPYFPAILSFVRRYDADAGIGTLVSLMLPYSVAFGLAWTALFLGWYGLELPFGPDVPLHYLPGAR